MTIQKFLAEYLRARLAKTTALVVYDPEKRYRDIVLGLAGGDCHVVDGSNSTILGREQALEIWRQLVTDPNRQQTLLIYLPIEKPRTVEERQQDPYQIFAIGGGEFPRDDGDDYQALCQRAAPELASQLAALFQAGVPDFATINTLLAGQEKWPRLRTLLKVESRVEILVALLSPAAHQKKALEDDASWVAEGRDFVRVALGLELKTESEKWAKINEELWRYVLFSEFALDLPVPLPEALQEIPRAPEAHKELIFKVCETLRTSEKHQELYLEQAEKVAAELQLEDRLRNVGELGARDTFPFQEKLRFQAFVSENLIAESGRALKVMEERQQSIWAKHKPDRQLLWTIAEQILKLKESIKDLQAKWPEQSRNLSQLLNFYSTSMRQADRLHRELEKAVAKTYGELEELAEPVAAVRRKYIGLLEEIQAAFIQLVQQEGWPAAGELRQTQVFDKFVAPWLRERQKTAYLMVDALRYELGAELERELAAYFRTELLTVCAQLPTLTSVGMAALLPEAEGKLRLGQEGGTLIPYLGEKKVNLPPDRLAYLQSQYGDRVYMVELDQLLTKKTPSWPVPVDLLLIRTLDLDLMGENKPLEAFRIFPELMRKIIAGLKKLPCFGFARAVIVTDHGFLLLSERQYGDAIAKPPGDWQVTKDRCLLGTGSGSDGIAAFAATEVGIRGDFATYAVPRTFATFTKGCLYFHGGLSLQEAVLPLILVDLAQSEKVYTKATVELSYKGKTSGSVTTRMPMVEISVQGDMFEEELEINLNAYAKKKVVGEVIPGRHINPATNCVRIRPGEALKVPLRLDEDFRGKFEVKATDPATGIVLATLKLETNYLD